jgi:hypothetical protein
MCALGYATGSPRYRQPPEQPLAMCWDDEGGNAGAHYRERHSPIIRHDRFRAFRAGAARRPASRPASAGNAGAILQVETVMDDYHITTDDNNQYPVDRIESPQAAARVDEQFVRFLGAASAHFEALRCVIAMVYSSYTNKCFYWGDPMHQAFVYRLCPLKTQERRLEQVREICRRFYE